MKRKISLHNINCRIKKLSREIIALTDQQAKHRMRVENGDSDKFIFRFIRVVGGMIHKADKEMQVLIKQRDNLMNDR